MTRPDAPGCTADRDRRQHGREHEFVREKIGVPALRSRSRHGAMTIRRRRRSQPEPQLALMVRAFLACRRQRPSWPGPSPQPHRRKPQDRHRRWRDTTAFSFWPGRGIPVPARACWRTSRRRACPSTWSATAGLLTPGRDRGDSAAEWSSPAPPRPAAPGGSSRGCRLVTRPSSSQRHHTPSTSVNSANAVMSASARAATGCGFRCVS